MNSETGIALLISGLVILFPVVFVFFWCGVVYLLAWLSGWRCLAQRYRSAGNLRGQSVGGFLAMLGPVSYRGTLTVQATPEGLALSVLFLFRMGHPSLLIPWCDIKTQGTARRMFSNWLTLTLGNPECTILRLPAKLVDQDVLERYSRS